VTGTGPVANLGLSQGKEGPEPAPADGWNPSKRFRQVSIFSQDFLDKVDNRGVVFLSEGRAKPMTTKETKDLERAIGHLEKAAAICDKLQEGRMYTDFGDTAKEIREVISSDGGACGLRWLLENTSEVH
jgi:hypothetical protein